MSETRTKTLVTAARQLLDQMGLSLADLHDTGGTRPTAPTFTEYLPIMRQHH